MAKSSAGSKLLKSSSVDLGGGIGVHVVDGQIVLMLPIGIPLTPKLARELSAALLAGAGAVDAREGRS